MESAIITLFTEQNYDYVLGEWLLRPLKEPEARDFLEIAEKRYHKASTIFCSQFGVGGWPTPVALPQDDKWYS